MFPSLIPTKLRGLWMAYAPELRKERLAREARELAEHEARRAAHPSHKALAAKLAVDAEEILAQVVPNGATRPDPSPPLPDDTVAPIGKKPSRRRKKNT